MRARLQADARIDDPLDYIQRSVRGTIVDNDQLEISKGLGQGGMNRLSDIVGHVVRRGDDTERRKCSHAGIQMILHDKALESKERCMRFRAATVRERLLPRAAKRSS